MKAILAIIALIAAAAFFIGSARSFISGNFGKGVGYLLSSFGIIFVTLVLFG